MLQSLKFFLQNNEDDESPKKQVTWWNTAFALGLGSFNILEYPKIEENSSIISKFLTC